jgi:3-deoxy-7-phosphoheptulonate synthase
VSAIDDVRIESIGSLVAPDTVIARFPVSETVTTLIKTTRTKIANIMSGDDERLLVVIGPCSIHDASAAREYAAKLMRLREKYADKLEIVMRAYFEKPRTSLGWKGYINDPFLDGSFRINEGLALARKLLLEINNMGLPTAGGAVRRLFRHNILLI